MQIVSEGYRDRYVFGLTRRENLYRSPFKAVLWRIGWWLANWSGVPLRTDQEFSKHRRSF